MIISEQQLHSLRYNFCTAHTDADSIRELTKIKQNKKVQAVKNLRGFD